MATRASTLRPEAFWHRSIFSCCSTLHGSPASVSQRRHDATTSACLATAHSRLPCAGTLRRRAARGAGGHIRGGAGVGVSSDAGPGPPRARLGARRAAAGELSLPDACYVPYLAWCIPDQLAHVRPCRLAHEIADCTLIASPTASLISYTLHGGATLPHHTPRTVALRAVQGDTNLLTYQPCKETLDFVTVSKCGAQSLSSCRRTCTPWST